ncbi:cadherin-related family member 5-like [Stegostoma tigrinum]|uniref:cadherin-related family member 5-like n=1 Tax=Stegostoma tigrinum TaxID=3053191 RepID=UPI0028703571|nr:cadherin-related family member 5-like [Stegostoma tigrinum]
MGQHRTTLARAGLLLLLTGTGFLLTSTRPDCGGVLLPTATHNILRYALLVTDSFNGTKCSWILQAASTETLELEVISYQTVSWTDASCTSAYLAIKLGPKQKERRLCDPFQSIPEVGRKLVFRGKGVGVVTLRAAYGMKQGFTVRYSVLVPDPIHGEVDIRALELQTVTPLPLAEIEQVDLSKREAGTHSTSTGQGQQIISQYPRMSNVREGLGPPWIHQFLWYPRHPKLSGILSGQGLRAQTQPQPRETLTRRNFKSDSGTKFHPKSLGRQTSSERSNTSPSLASFNIAAVSDSNTITQSQLTSIIQLLSFSDSALRSLSPFGRAPSSPSSPRRSPNTPSPSGLAPSSPSSLSRSPNTPSPSGLAPSSPSSPSRSPNTPSPSGLAPSSPSSLAKSTPTPTSSDLTQSSPSPSNLGPISPSLSGLGPSSLSGLGPSSPSPSGLSPSSPSPSGLEHANSVSSYSELPLTI